MPSHLRGSQHPQMTRASGKVPTDGPSDMRGPGKCGKVAPHGTVCAHFLAERNHIDIDARTRVYPDFFANSIEAAGHLSAEAKTLDTGKDVTLHRPVQIDILGETDEVAGDRALDGNPPR